MKRCSKQMFLILFLFAFSIQSLAQTKYDVFPLKKGMTYTYNIFQVDSAFELQNYFFLLNSDSGKVEYIINDSLNYGDTLTVWNIEQRRNLLHIYQYGNDTVSYDFINDTSYYKLFEYLSGDHELKCSSMIWSFQNINVYRYYDYDKFQNVYSDEDYCHKTEDSIWFSDKAGMYRRVVSDEYGLCNINRGLYNLYVERVDIPDKVEINNLSNVNKFILLQNYPNPFNPTTNINFSVGKLTNVELTVYNVLGQKVATLVNQRMAAGTYRIVWDASKMASGLYFYTMKTDNLKVTSKMMVIK